MTTSKTTTSAQPKIGERTRSYLLQAALDEFSARGFDAATIRDIAARAQLSHGMVRYHYETKERLWFATIAFLFERFAREMAYTKEELETAKGDELELFRIWLRKYVHYCARHPEHARIVMQESVEFSPRLEKAIDEHLREGHKRVRQNFERFKNLGLFPKSVPPESLVYIITGACQNIFMLAPESRLTFGYDPMTDKAINAHADAIIAIFCPETPVKPTRLRKR